MHICTARPLALEVIGMTWENTALQQSAGRASPEGPVGRPRSQRKEQAGAEAGDGDLDELESRTAVGTLIDDTGVGAQRRQGSGELC